MHRGGGPGVRVGAAVAEASRMRQPDPLPPELVGTPFTVRQARSAGVSRGRLRSSDLRSPWRGVRVPHGQPADLRHGCRSLLATLPPGAVFSHGTAARLLGLDLPWPLERDQRIHITVPVGSVPPRRAGVAAHTSARPPVVLSVVPAPTAADVDGLPITTPARTRCDLGSDLGVDDLVILADAMTRRRSPVTTPRGLHAELDGCPPGMRGLRRLRVALADSRARTDSAMETRTRLVLVRGGLPCPEVNRPVLDRRGRFLAMPDMSYPEHLVAVEYDGDVHRTERRLWLRDVERRELLIAAGWRVITATHDHVLHNPALLRTRVTQALAPAQTRAEI